MIIGSFGLISTLSWPLRILKSTGLTLAAWTSPSVSPGPIAGFGTSASESTFGPPYRLSSTARMGSGSLTARGHFDDGEIVGDDRVGKDRRCLGSERLGGAVALREMRQRETARAR